jgi:hypothetical protein
MCTLFANIRKYSSYKQFIMWLIVRADRRLEYVTNGMLWSESNHQELSDEMWAVDLIWLSFPLCVM